MRNPRNLLSTLTLNPKGSFVGNQGFSARDMTPLRSQNIMILGSRKLEKSLDAYRYIDIYIYMYI